MTIEREDTDLLRPGPLRRTQNETPQGVLSFLRTFATPLN